MKIYTRTGDDGSTGLLGNVRVQKDALRLDAYGTVDELNATLGILLAHAPKEATSAQEWISAIQSDLFIVGTLLAIPAGAKARTVLPVARVAALETLIDQMEETLTPLTHFILPQGSAACGFSHLARAICRRAERRVVALAAQERVDPTIGVYLNRLSDYLFVLARWLNVTEGRAETEWRYDDKEGAKTEGRGVAAKDRMDLTLKKLEQQKETRKTLFEKASGELAKKKEDAERAFKRSVDQIQKDGGKVEKPFRDMDLD